MDIFYFKEIWKTVFYSKTTWKIHLWPYFYNFLFSKWSNLDFEAAYPKFVILIAFHIVSQKNSEKLQPPQKWSENWEPSKNFGILIASNSENL